ncbi:MAG: hypothetical protein NTY12_00955 [Candidatus Falkowbacteria bacterium]|nr:hypothetical protein [Candidatus Falkowbacteria bacterium]
MDEKLVKAIEWANNLAASSEKDKVYYLIMPRRVKGRQKAFTGEIKLIKTGDSFSLTTKSYYHHVDGAFEKLNVKDKIFNYRVVESKEDCSGNLNLIFYKINFKTSFLVKFDGTVMITDNAENIPKALSSLMLAMLIG